MPRTLQSKKVSLARTTIFMSVVIMLAATIFFLRDYSFNYAIQFGILTGFGFFILGMLLTGLIGLINSDSES
jgi:hypothetical protein